MSLDKARQRFSELWGGDEVGVGGGGVQTTARCSGWTFQLALSWRWPAKRRGY